MDDDRWADWPERWVGTDCDVRAAVGAIPQEAKDGFRYDKVPWQRYEHFYGPGVEIPGLLTTLSSADVEAADEALGRLWTNLHH
ncbi:hypothetical protein ACFYS8_17800 [Kitasatospora sp. NPDC004615]|uniref:hypothetical protein n=1 Tax=Kitasatospora sp. NPDC004615 TaxID=3364017 RepID=UPI0036CF51F7